MEAHSRTLIKICGITTAADAALLVAAGADALGLNFSDQSARQVDPAVAAEIATETRDRLVRVGLFVDPTVEFVDQVLAKVDLDVLQFHGDESAELCGIFGLPYMKVLRVSGPLDMEALEASYADACCLLLDAYVAGQPGGTGQRFDWSAWPRDARMPLVLAGGLTPANVESAIFQLHPYAVDVCGGVEGPLKGVKDPTAIDEFVAAVRRADRQAV
jgi:phosphoribosylanthranilate isomerase